MAFGSRLRIVMDNSDRHGEPDSDEDGAEASCVRQAFTISRGLQHSKVIIAKCITSRS